MVEESDGRLFGREARIWNRSLEPGASNLGPGDRALGAVLWVDGLVANGGVHHALEIVVSAELDAAADGFAYFGLNDIAELLRRRRSDPVLATWTEETETIADELYWSMMGDGDAIARQFQRLLRERPKDFAPLADES
jgi:hypothetical protein